MIVKIEEDPLTGELILPLPEEILKELDWQIDDKLKWIDNEDGTVYLTRYEEADYE